MPRCVGGNSTLEHTQGAAASVFITTSASMQNSAKMQLQQQAHRNTPQERQHWCAAQAHRSIFQEQQHWCAPQPTTKQCNDAVAANKHTGTHLRSSSISVHHKLRQSNAKMQLQQHAHLRNCSTGTHTGTHLRNCSIGVHHNLTQSNAVATSTQEHTSGAAALVCTTISSSCSALSSAMDL